MEPGLHVVGIVKSVVKSIVKSIVKSVVKSIVKSSTAEAYTICIRYTSGRLN